MKSKEIYQSIDQAKVKKLKGGDKIIANIKRVEKETKGFTVENPKFDVAMTKLYGLLKSKNPEVLKDVKVEEKVTEVKVPTTKAERKKKPAKKTKTVKKTVKKATGKKKNTKPTPTPSAPKTKKVPFSTRAKQLADKEGISFAEARKKLSKQIKDEEAKIEKKVKSDLDKLLAFVRSDKFEDGEKYPKTYGQQSAETSSLSSDAKRKAKPRGKRISKKGAVNQHGVSEGGNVYYEYRDNRSDRNSIKAPQGQYKYKGKTPPYLEAGGEINSVHAVHIKDNMSLLNASKKYSNVKMDKPPLGSIVGQTYVTIDGKRQNLFVGDKYIAKNKQIIEVYKPSKGLYMRLEAGGTLPTPFGQAGLVGETGAMNEMELFAMGGGLPQGVHQYYAQTYNPAYPTPHGYAKGGMITSAPEYHEVRNAEYERRVKSGKIKDTDENFEKFDEMYFDELVEKGRIDPDNYFAKGGEIDSAYVDELRFGTGMSKDAIEELIERNNFSKDDVLNLIVGLGRGFIKPSLVSSAYFGGKTSKENKKLVEFAKSNKAFKMAKGGELSKEFKFDKNFVIYVPSTSNVGDTISKAELDKRVDEVERFVANKFGGYTETETDGGYKSTSGKIIEEDIVKVSVFAKANDWKKNEKSVISKVRRWAKKWGQEAIGFEYEGDLYYVSDSKVMKNGGVIDAFNLQFIKDVPKTNLKVEKVKNKISYKKGGKIGFDALSKKVAKRYEGKAVPKKYQREYGKRYSKVEAQEVGDKVASKVYRQQLKNK